MNAQFIGTGRLGRDPELRFTTGGKAVCELAVAFSNSTKKRGEDTYTYSPAQWVSITLWEAMAENAAELLRKGDEVVCAGVMEIEEFQYTRGERAGETGSKTVLKMAEVAPSIRRRVPFARTDGRGETQPRAQQTRQQARQAPPRAVGMDRTGQPVGAGVGAAAPAYGDEPPF